MTDRWVWSLEAAGGTGAEAQQSVHPLLPRRPKDRPGTCTVFVDGLS